MEPIQKPKRVWTDAEVQELKGRVQANLDRAADLIARLREELDYWDRGGMPPEPGGGEGPAGT